MLRKMCVQGTGEQRIGTQALSGKIGFFREGRVELDLESEFVHPMVKWEGRALHSKQGKQHMQRHKRCILGERGSSNMNGTWVA